MFARTVSDGVFCSPKRYLGEVAEWPIAPVLKTGVGSNLPGVRISPSPLNRKGLTSDRRKSFFSLCTQKMYSPACAGWPVGAESLSVALACESCIR